MFGPYSLFKKEVTVQEDAQYEINFDVPLLTEVEQEKLNSRETYIKENWYVPKNRDMLEDSFNKLYTML